MLNNDSKILVTGGAGFIGSNLVESLLRNKYNVIVLDNLTTGHKSNLQKVLNEIDLIVDNLETYDLSQLRNITAVIHLSAQASVPISIENFKASSTANILGSIKVIDFCKQLNIPLIYASSSAIYGKMEEGDDDATEIDLLSPYSVDKYAMEMYAKVANQIYGLSSVGLRFFNVYGPRQDPSSPYSGVISIFTDSLLKGESITINGGYQTRDFIYVYDVVRAIEQSLLNAFKTCECEQINILTGHSISIDKLAGMLIDKIGVKVQITYQELQIGDPVHSNGTCKKMKRLLKIDHRKLTPLSAGLTETINFLLQEES